MESKVETEAVPGEKECMNNITKMNMCMTLNGLLRWSKRPRKL
jgi:hypothetical protein